MDQGSLEYARRIGTYQRIVLEHSSVNHADSSSASRDTACRDNRTRGFPKASVPVNRSRLAGELPCLKKDLNGTGWDKILSTHSAVYSRVKILWHFIGAW